MLRAAIACLSLALLGGLCSGSGGGGSGGGSASPPETLAIWFDPGVRSVSLGAKFSVDVVIHSDAPSPQAWEIRVTTDPSVVGFDHIDLHPDYDDDGSLFLTPQIDNQAGVASGIVDVRHGTHALSGEIRIATLTLDAVGAGSTWVEVEVVGAAEADGRDFDVSVLDHLVVSVSP